MNIVALLLFLLPLAYSPGPGNLFFASLSARAGFRGTWGALLGYHLATIIAALAIGFGVGLSFEQGSLAFMLIQFAGTAYLLYLSWVFWGAGATGEHESKRGAGFISGALILILNPKAYVIMLLMFSQFGVGAGNAQIIYIALCFTLNNLIAFILWALAGDTLGQLFRAHASARLLNRSFAVMLAIVAIWMAFI